MKHIGQELAEARRQRGVTQGELAKQLGVRQDRVSRIEHEQNPRLDTVQSYARALGLELTLVPRQQLASVHALLEGKESAPGADDSGSRFPSLADLVSE